MASSPIVEAIQTSRERFSSAIRQGDPSGVATLYAEDARLLLPASARVDGRAAIEGFWRSGIAAGLAAFEAAPEELLVESAFACEVGRYRLRVEPAKEAATVEAGRYLTVLRLGPDGSWRRALEVYDRDGG